MKLYYSRNLNPRLCVAAAQYLKAPVDYIVGHTFDPERREFFYPLNPNLRVPILVEDDGTSFWETDAIVCRLAHVVRSDFFPQGAQLPELVRWLSWSAYHWVRAGADLYFDRITVPRYGLEHLSSQQVRDSEQDFHAAAKILDEVLAGREWLIGGRLSYADFRIGTVLPFAEEARLELDRYPHLRRFRAQLEEIPAWRDPFAGLADVGH